MTEKSAGDSGVFSDAGRHAPELCCYQANVERVNERPVIWRPLSKNKRIWSVLSVCALSHKEAKSPKQDPRK